jgi:hypothetical protein
MMEQSPDSGQAGVEITPAMIEAADRWLEDNRGVIEEGGTGDLRDLVAKVLSVHRACKRRTA